MTVYVFPGQGSQAKGMGADLFDQFPERTEEADALLGYSIKELCLLDPHEHLAQTKITQPALFVVNALTYLNKVQQTGQKPHYLAGHSLGEYNALFAAEVFDFATGLTLVKKRGELMSQATQGTMAAVIGLSPQEIEQICSNHALHQVGIANYNSKNQLVISGDSAEIMTALPLFIAAGAIMARSLNVSGAFHSPLMHTAQMEFAEFLKPFHFAPPKIPVIANVTAAPYPHTSDNIKDLLTRQISNPVRFAESINYLLAQGEQEFEEIGPGKVLAKTIQRIRNGQ
jgi:malonyl CoA-acyl carrier protein transacylase